MAGRGMTLFGRLLKSSKTARRGLGEAEACLLLLAEGPLCIGVAALGLAFNRQRLAAVALLHLLGEEQQFQLPKMAQAPLSRSAAFLNDGGLSLGRLVAEQASCLGRTGDGGRQSERENEPPPHRTVHL